MANENFTSGWTETDSDGVLSETSSTITVASMNAAPSNCYLTKDQGASFYNGDFTFRFGPIRITAASSSNSRIAPLKVSMALDNGDNIEGQSLQVRWNNTATNPTLYLSYFASSGLAESAPTTQQSYQGAGVALNTDFYIELKRTGTTAQLKIFSDSGYSSQVGSTLSFTVTAHAYRYVHAAAKWDTGSGATVSGTLQNLDLSAGAAPTQAISGSGSATASGSGTIVKPGLTVTLRDTDTGALKNAVTYANVHIWAASARGSAPTSLTSKTTSSVGVLLLNAPGLVIGTTYDVVGFTSDGSDRFHASAVAADS